MTDSNVKKLPPPAAGRKAMTLADHMVAAGISNPLLLGINIEGQFIISCSESMTKERALYLLEKARINIMGLGD